MIAVKKDAVLEKLFDNMRAEVDRSVEHYRSDFDVDKEILAEALKGDRFIWATRTNGTYMIPLSHMYDDKYLKAFTDMQHGIRGFFYLEKGKEDLTEITREKAQRLIEESREYTFGRMGKGDAVLLSYDTWDGRKEDYYTKISDDKVMLVNRKQGKEEYNAFCLLGKDDFLKKVVDEQEAHPGIGMRVDVLHDHFNEKELSALYDFRPVVRKPGLKRRGVERTNESNGMAL